LEDFFPLDGAKEDEEKAIKEIEDEI